LKVRIEHEMNKTDSFSCKDITVGVIIYLIFIVLSFVFIKFFSFIFYNAKNLFELIRDPYATVALIIELTVIFGIFLSVSKISKLLNTRKVVINIINIAMCLVIASTIWFSYSISKKTADNIVGSSKKYFALSKYIVIFDPIHRNRLVWFFEYSHPTIMDASFEIYTTFSGELAFTNPTNLYDRLRAMEKEPVHPYDR